MSGPGAFQARECATVTLTITDVQREQARRRLELIAAGRAAVARGADASVLLEELRVLGASRDDATVVAGRVLGWTPEQAGSAMATHPAWQVAVAPQLTQQPWSPSVAQSTPRASRVFLLRFNAIIFAVALVCGVLAAQAPGLLLVVGLGMLILPFSSAMLIVTEVRTMRRGDGENLTVGLLIGIAILLATGALWFVVLWFLMALTS